MDRKGLKIAFGASAVLIVLLAGCGEKEKFPPEPRIAFERFEQFADSSSLTISFTDGDGDIGFNQSDTFPPFNAGSVYHHNLFVKLEGRRNGEWEASPFDLNYRIPYLTPSGQNKTLKGELSVSLSSSILGIGNGPDGTNIYDAVRFDIRLFDRALHESNTAQSGDLGLQ
jgi:hypothetical protein